MAATADVLILGGGVIGLTTAYCLAEEGIRVAVLDRSDLGREASWAGAGIIPPGDPAPARDADRPAPRPQRRDVPRPLAPAA